MKSHLWFILALVVACMAAWAFVGRASSFSPSGPSFLAPDSHSDRVDTQAVDKPSLASSPAPERALVPSAVIGRVIDLSAHPVAEAAVALYRGSIESKRSAVKVAHDTSDADGVFEFPSVPTDSEYFVVAKSRGADRTYASVVIGSPVEVVLERAEKAAHIRVRVVDGQKRPIEAFEVTIASVEREQRMLLREKLVYSVDGVFDGAIFVPQGSGHDVQVVVDARGFSRATSAVVPVRAGADVHEFTIVAQSTPFVEGVVFAKPTGQPVANASLRAIRRDGQEQRTAYSDAAGRFELAHGQCTDLSTLTVEATGFAPLVLREDQLQQGSVILELESGALVAGRVLDELGRGAGNVTVAAWVEADLGKFYAPTWKRAVSTRSDGTFRMEGLPTGEVLLAVVEQSDDAGVHSCITTRRVSVRSGEEAWCDLDLSSVQPIVGHVVLPEFAGSSFVWIELHSSADSDSGRVLASWCGPSNSEFVLRPDRQSAGSSAEIRAYFTPHKYVSYRLQMGSTNPDPVAIVIPVEVFATVTSPGQ
ncbi:MAG: carboxypeptidase-like regulatory domain-containing protein [Vicinamibacterales bacterium]